jgi:hypothetical protein
MARNQNARKFIKWALLEYEVGEDFVLDDLIVRMMTPSRARGNIKRKRMTTARASTLLREWVVKGYVSKTKTPTKKGSLYTLRRRVDDSSPIEQD